MGYLGLWHWPRTDAPYICIEPWCSLPSFAGQIAVFEEQKDLISLPAGQIYRNIWTIEIS
jgi:galactose mutarotase-like enzyme